MVTLRSSETPGYKTGIPSPAQTVVLSLAEEGIREGREETIGRREEVKETQ
jgi:hypothetical protein